MLKTREVELSPHLLKLLIKKQRRQKLEVMKQLGGYPEWVTAIHLLVQDPDSAAKGWVGHLQCEAREKGSWRQAQGEVVSLNCRIHLVKEELDSSGSPCPVRKAGRSRKSYHHPWESYEGHWKLGSKRCGMKLQGAEFWETELGAEKVAWESVVRIVEGDWESMGRVR